MASTLGTIAQIYRQSKKRNDNLWTEWCSRPFAAVLVWMLKSTPITPNQVSFLAIAIAAAGCGALIAWTTWLGLIVGGLTLQLAYIVDCADGQLARTKQQTSPVGALLDFMLDEVKAFLVLGSSAIRLWELSGETKFLLIGLAGLFACATGITLTSFMRRPEYLDAVGAPPILPATDRAGFLPAKITPGGLVLAAGKLALHYPSWFLVVCALNRLDWFLYLYVGSHVAYLGRASLIILIRLGSPSIYKKREERAS